jgi:hypothetical protein
VREDAAPAVADAEELARVAHDLLPGGAVMMVAVVLAVVAVVLRRGVRRRCSEPGENEREQDED